LLCLDAKSPSPWWAQPHMKMKKAVDLVGARSWFYCRNSAESSRMLGNEHCCYGINTG
jgi:hypothetical protein